MRKTILRLCLWAAFALLLAAALPVYGQAAGFSNIRYAARMQNGTVAVMDEGKNSYTFTIFDENGRYLRRYREHFDMSISGPGIRYVSMASLGESLYLHRKTYREDGSHIQDSIMELNAGGMREVYSNRSSITDGSLAVLDGKLYLLEENVPPLASEGFYFSGGTSSLVLTCRDTGGEWIQEDCALPAVYGSAPVYSGNGSFIFADEDARAVQFNGETGTLRLLPRGGSVDRVCVYGEYAAFFDLSSGEILLYDTGGGLLYAYAPSWTPGILDLGAGGIAAVETDENQRGKTIRLLDWDGTAFQSRIFSANFLCLAALRDRLPAAALLLLGCILLRLALHWFFRRTVSVTVRIAALLIPISILGTMAAVSAYSRFFFAQLSTLEAQNFASFTQELDSQAINEAILAVSLETSVNGDAYSRLLAAFGQLTPDGRRNGSAAVSRYFDVFLKVGDGFFTAYSRQYPKGSNVRHLFTEKDYADLVYCASSGQRRHYEATYALPYACNRIPVYDGYGSLYAVLELGLDVTADAYLAEVLAGRQAIPIVVAMTLAFTVFMLVIRLSLRSLRILKTGVERVKDGERDVRIAVKTKDEFGAIARAFNQMSAYVDERVRESEAYHRFIPDEIFELFGKRLDSLRRGDSISLPVTLMCLGVPTLRGGTADPSGMRGLSGRFDTVADIVRREGGYLKDIDSSGTFCFFCGHTARALTAALDIGDALSSYGVNAALGFGDAALSVMGEASRWQIALVSGMSETLRALCLHAAAFGARILLTKEAFDALEEKDSFHCRYLGEAAVQGSVVGLYDMFDADSREIYTQKQATLPDFEAGVAHFTQGEADKARDAFIRVLRMFPEDGVSRQYLRLCEEGGRTWLTAATPGS